jgi:hypothetical protein
VFVVPSSSSTARIYDPVGNSLSTPGGTYQGTSEANYTGKLLADGTVFNAPCNSTTARIYDPVADSVSTPTGPWPGAYNVIGSVMLNDGRVFVVPHNGTTARIYGTSTGTLPLARVLSAYDNKM